MRFFKKVEASSLLITLIIALVVGVLCTSLILVSYYNRIIDIGSRTNDKLDRNLESGINIALADTSYSLLDKRDTVDLFGDKNDSVEIVKKNWGLFNTASVMAFSATKSKKKEFIYGSELPLYMDGCLYLTDKQRPLALVGDVTLFGKAYLPKAGVRPSFIDQRGFSYKELIQGEILQSSGSLPQLDSQRLNILRDYLTYIEAPPVSAVSINTFTDSLTNSFNDSLIYYFNEEEIDLSAIKITGQIIIISGKKIIVDSTSLLNNVLIIAPEINFKKGFSGIVQAFATKEINVEKNCTFQYPSCLVIVHKSADLDLSKLKLASGVNFNGILLGIHENDATANYISVEIEKGTEITGIVYVDGFLAIQGKVFGTVMTNLFIYKSPGTIYENNLVDVEFNRKKLSPYFLASPIFNKKGKNKIIQWVN
jgi:hypothetical protein